MVNWGKLIFGGVDSSEYGIYITGQGVFNAPERVVEFVDVPGRNGSIAMDQGRYNNITVTYSAGTFAKSPEEFREKLSAFRNAIISQKGYQKLEDSYHPEEYRMGLYASGLDVDAVHMNQAGQFELEFNCKPQRWLSVGALPIPVNSGDYLLNPTPFESGPLLEITGYGDISFNGFTVSLNNAVLSDIQLINSFFDTTVETLEGATKTLTKTFVLDGDLFNIGDTITVKASQFRSEFYSSSTRNGPKSYSGTGDTEGSGSIILIDDYRKDVYVRLSDLSFIAGTSATKTYTYTVVFETRGQTPNTELGTLAVTGTIAYVYSNGVHTLTFTVTGANTNGTYNPPWVRIIGGKTTVNSSVSTLGNPTYVDCDLGEAYRLANCKPVSLNTKVAFGSDLPVLAPGTNKITFDNTVTDLKIAPRWWRI